MNTLNARIKVVQDKIAREYRKPVIVAANLSDGTFLSFQQELAAQAWDYPNLPVQRICDMISYDIA